MAQNSEWLGMHYTFAGFYELSSPDLALKLPISASVVFDDGSVLVLENVVEFL
jgi:hypothetical protein